MNNIRVIVIEPSAPGNPGSIARAMANFGAADLVFVNPQPFDMKMAGDFACNGRHVIENARSVSSFEEALSGTVFTVGTTRRAGDNEPSYPAHDASGIIIQHAAAGPAALVFGREKSGLTKEEKSRCHILAGIDTVEGAAGSLNISHAAAVFLYECWCACASADIRAASDTGPVEDAFNAMLSRVHGFREPGVLQQIFSSVMKRSALNDNEVKKLTRAFGAAAAFMKEENKP